MTVPGPHPALGVYGISVAAELVGMGTQTLRLYERRGLLEPARTNGGTRRYSEDDLDRLRRIGELLASGLNLAGVARVLDLESDNAQLRASNTQLRADNAQLREAKPHPQDARPPSPARAPVSTRRRPKAQKPTNTSARRSTRGHRPLG